MSGGIESCWPRTRTRSASAGRTCASRSRRSGCTGFADRRDQRVPRRPPVGAGGDRGDRGGDGRAGRGLHALRRRWPRGAGSWPRRLPRRPDEPSDFSFLYPDSATLKEKIGRSRRRSTAPTGWTTTMTASSRLATYEATADGILPVLHRQDPPVGCLRPGRSKGAPTDWRLPVRRCGPRSVPGSSTRSAATCAPCPASAPPRRPIWSTSTRTATSSTCRASYRYRLEFLVGQSLKEQRRRGNLHSSPADIPPRPRPCREKRQQDRRARRRPVNSRHTR